MPGGEREVESQQRERRECSHCRPEELDALAMRQSHRGGQTLREYSGSVSHVVAVPDAMPMATPLAMRPKKSHSRRRLRGGAYPGLPKRLSPSQGSAYAWRTTDMSKGGRCGPPALRPRYLTEIRRGCALGCLAIEIASTPLRPVAFTFCVSAVSGRMKRR